MSGKIPYYDGADVSPYMRIPQYIFADEKLSHLAIFVYGFMLSRASSSAKNEKFHDGNGVFIYASVDEMESRLNRGKTAINNAINLLISSGYIKKKRMGFNHSNKYYVMIPSDDRFSGHPDNRKSGHPED